MSSSSLISGENLNIERTTFNSAITHPTTMFSLALAIDSASAYHVELSIATPVEPPELSFLWGTCIFCNANALSLK